MIALATDLVRARFSQLKTEIQTDIYHLLVHGIIDNNNLFAVQSVGSLYCAHECGHKNILITTKQFNLEPVNMNT